MYRCAFCIYGCDSQIRLAVVSQFVHNFIRSWRHIQMIAAIQNWCAPTQMAVLNRKRYKTIINVCRFSLCPFRKKSNAGEHNDMSISYYVFEWTVHFNVKVFIVSTIWIKNGAVFNMCARWNSAYWAEHSFRLLNRCNLGGGGAGLIFNWVHQTNEIIHNVTKSFQDSCSEPRDIWTKDSLLQSVHLNFFF